MKKKFIRCETCGRKITKTVWSSTNEFYCSQKCLLKAPYIEKQSLTELIKAYGDQLTCKDDGEIVFADELS